LGFNGGRASSFDIELVREFFLDRPESCSREGTRDLILRGRERLPSILRFRIRTGNDWIVRTSWTRQFGVITGMPRRSAGGTYVSSNPPTPPFHRTSAQTLSASQKRTASVWCQLSEPFLFPMDLRGRWTCERQLPGWRTSRSREGSRGDERDWKSCVDES
jgi:hypothetical protein